MKEIDFESKEGGGLKISMVADQILEMIPDADMRYTLLITKDGGKHFVKGTQAEIQSRLTSSIK
jgi:photosystem II stability/assembly factor-like uncharacterized protein